MAKYRTYWENGNIPEYTCPPEFYADRFPEYWAGWVLAYVQWEGCFSFHAILQRISVEKILGLYPTGHEQDVRNVAEILSEWMGV